MSATADVREMQTLCEALAEKLAFSEADKDQIRAILKVFSDGKGAALITANRAFEFLRGKARRVDSWEKDIARQELRRLEEAERAAALQGHVLWLRRSAEYLRATDEERHRFDIDALEQAVRVAGSVGGSLVAVASEDTDKGAGR